LKTTVQALKTNNNRTNPNTNHRDNGNYCWTHGFRVGNKHTSETCQNPACGHKKEATRTNTMGGSQVRKPQ
jgi:hypothetical protein